MRQNRQCQTRQNSRHARGVQRRPGFTLVELLVVISIIALLISILLPSLRSAREQAKLVKCTAHQRGIAQGSLTFATENNDRFQLVTNATGVEKADNTESKFAYTGDGELMAWPVAVAQASGMSISENWQWGVRANGVAQALDRTELMSDEFEMFTCPADRVKVATTFWPQGTGKGMLKGAGNPRETVDDSIDGGTSYWGRLSYGINEDIVGSEIKNVTGSVGRWIRNPRDGTPLWQAGEISAKPGQRFQGDINRIFDPATVLLMTDAGANDEQTLRSAVTNNADDQASLINLIISAQWKLTSTQKDQMGAFMHWWYNRVPYKRHPKGQIGVVFADYHAESVSPTEWKLQTNSKKQQPYKYGGRIRISPYSTSPTQ